jgi:hypothetical protein
MQSARWAARSPQLANVTPIGNAAGTNIQNEPQNDIQNDETAKIKTGAK